MIRVLLVAAVVVLALPAQAQFSSTNELPGTNQPSAWIPQPLLDAEGAHRGYRRASHRLVCVSRSGRAVCHVRGGQPGDYCRCRGARGRIRHR